jgi:hypothetical protein
MGRIDSLLENYQRHLELPLRQGLPLSQRVWFAVYPPEEERRLTNRIDEFEIATIGANLRWKRLDLTGSFAEWMDTFDPEERDECLANPAIVEAYAEEGYRDFVCSKIEDTLTNAPQTEAPRTVVAVSGLMELYDFVHVSAVIDNLNKTFPGVLLVFFPGDREGNTYRFLGARSGWDYLAVPILAES